MPALGLISNDTNDVQEGKFIENMIKLKNSSVTIFALINHSSMSDSFEGDRSVVKPTTAFLLSADFLYHMHLQMILLMFIIT